MTKTIGFSLGKEEVENNREVVQERTVAPRKSLVEVSFGHCHYTYYNDKFDLQIGDAVYVDGKFEGTLGHVISISYSFKIKVSDYKKVIAVADTNIKGEFFFAGSHFVTFERNALPKEKAVSWFKPPLKDDDEFVESSDGVQYNIDCLSEIVSSPEVAERGHGLYMSNCVKYLCLDKSHVYAIVEGSETYEVEFDFDNGIISNLVCPCYFAGNCKHEFAAILQLRDILGFIEENYQSEFRKTEYFSAVTKPAFFNFAVDGQKRGSIKI